MGHLSRHVGRVLTTTQITWTKDCETLVALVGDIVEVLDATTGLVRYRVADQYVQKKKKEGLEKMRLNSKENSAVKSFSMSPSEEMVGTLHHG